MYLIGTLTKETLVQNMDYELVDLIDIEELQKLTDN